MDITMRDTFINKIYQQMQKDDSIFFLTADFGAPSLDKLRTTFGNRFINVGIAEQNLINVATGLALEGLNVYAYGIAPFITMRAYEQLRNNLSIHGRNLNVNIIGVGTGLSYDVSGPAHHCLEDISIIRTLPNIQILSPSDNVMVEKIARYSLEFKKPKYIRLDSKPLPIIHKKTPTSYFSKGYYELIKGDNACIISTGYMTHKALEASELLKKKGINIGVIDLVLIKPLITSQLLNTLSRYSHIVTIEEGFIGKGGLDSLILNLINNKLNIHNEYSTVDCMGFDDQHTFENGTREYILQKNGLFVQHIADKFR